MGTYVFDPNARNKYVLVQMSAGTKTFWNGSDFVEDLEQAIKFPDYGEAGRVLWHEIDEKHVKARIVPMPLSAL
jgi:hypothetical protein